MAPASTAARKERLKPRALQQAGDAITRLTTFHGHHKAPLLARAAIGWESAPARECGASNCNDDDEEASIMEQSAIINLHIMRTRAAFECIYDRRQQVGFGSEASYG